MSPEFCEELSALSTKAAGQCFFGLRTKAHVVVGGKQCNKASPLLCMACP